MKKEVKHLAKSIGIGLAIVFALVIYAYGFKVTKVNLDETRSPRRQEQLARILRALAKPDLIEFKQTEFLVDLPIMVPCPEGGFTPPEQDTSKPYIVAAPACADPGSLAQIEGYNFAPNAEGPINFIPPSQVKLTLGRFQADETGHFSLTVKLPNRKTTELNHLTATTRTRIGGPSLSQNAIDTWDKIVETVFLALLATTLGLLFAVPLSFFAARNLMKDVTSPLLNVSLSILALPVGAYLGSMVSSFAGSTVNHFLKDSPLLNLAGVIIGGAIVFWAVRWAVPADEPRQPGIRLRIMRIAVLALTVLISLIGLYMLSSLAMWIGKTLEVHLGTIGFLGTFIADLGDILGMTLTVISALTGAGVLMSLTDRFGRKIIKTVPLPVSKTIMITMSAIAGAALFYMIMAGLDWLYQFDKKALTTVWPLSLGAIFGLILSIRLNAKDNFPIGIVIYYIARTIFNALRSIEALIMVIVFVVWVGIGPFAGVLALSLHTVAALAKLYSEQVESILSGPLEAIKSTGANRLQTIVYAVMPQIVPPYISFTMYRWDINVRMSTIIGFAGGGGIGFLLIQNINLLNYRAASAQMLAIALVVASMDYISSRLREETI